MNTKMPLASFCLKSFNQKEYLRDALLGAFAQTYRPLEIVVADDLSTDGSQDMIKELIERFKNEHAKEIEAGILSVIFIENDVNLGMTGNWQKLLNSSHGELIIHADGDDVSLPNRTSEIVSAYLNHNRKPTCIYNGAVKIDAAGKTFGECPHNMLWTGPTGAIVSYSRRVVDEFPQINEKYFRYPDDVIYGFRARLLNPELIFVSTPLVHYRIGSGESTSITDYRTRMGDALAREIYSREQNIIDAKFKGADTATIEQTILRLQTLVHLWKGTSFSERFGAYRKLYASFSKKQRLIGFIVTFGRISDLIFDSFKLLKYRLLRK